MKTELLIPLLITNGLSFLMVALSFYKPRMARIFWGVIFLVAGIFNIVTALKNPATYVDGFGKVAYLELYTRFIYGFFSQHTLLVILVVAIGQLLISVGLIFGNKLFKLSIIGGIIFFVSIAPLGIGSAFPSTLVMALSLAILYYKAHIPYQVNSNHSSIP